MNSETQSNPKPAWKDAALAFLVVAAIMGGIAVLSKLIDPQANVWSFLYLAPLGAGLALLSVARLKVITILSLLVSIIFLVVSFVTKDHNPKLSSLSFLNAFIALAGAIVPTLVSRTQTFLYDRGFRGMGFDVNSQYGFTEGNGSDSGWGSGDCGGDGGSGGDCGG